MSALSMAGVTGTAAAGRGSGADVNGKIVHVADDGTQTDITEAVRALYGQAIRSTDDDSGFLSYEDALPVAAIARLCDCDTLDVAEWRVRQALHQKEADEWLAAKPREERLSSFFSAYVNGQYAPHDHVWSSVGKCMWTYCPEVRDADQR